MEPNGIIVVIDAGHGGVTSVGKSTAFGARGPSGTLEKDVTLSLATEIARHLGQGSVLTRVDDRNLSLAERCERARRAGAAVFISLHTDANDLAQRGSRTFSRHR